MKWHRVVVEGQRYKGKFAAVHRSEAWVKDSVRRWTEEYHHYEGTGLIEDVSNGSRYFFTFRSSVFEILHYEWKTTGKVPPLEKVVSFTGEADQDLGRIVARLQASREPIPSLQLESNVLRFYEPRQAR